MALVCDGGLRSCLGWSRGRGSRVVSGLKGASRLKLRFWNIGSLTGKGIELVKILEKR